MSFKVLPCIKLGRRTDIVVTSHPTATMVSFISKLKSMTSSKPEPTEKTKPAPLNKPLAKKSLQQHPNVSSPSARSTQSISPKLRLFYDPLSPNTRNKLTAQPKLGVLESPKTPESAYSGAVIHNAKELRRVSKGEIKKIDLSHAKSYESATAGTQTDERAVADNVKELLKRRSGLAKSGWEWLHSGDAGLLFMSNGTTADQKRSKETTALSDADTNLPLTGNLLLKLQQAIAIDVELQACQKRTAREIATLNAYHENLRNRKKTLKGKLEYFKTMTNGNLDEEKSAVDNELVQVWEASIDTMDERLRIEERLEKKREEFELVARGALSVLALGLAERMLVDVEEGHERRGSEGEFEMRYWLAER
jgi:hypothetical protein